MGSKEKWPRCPACKREHDPLYRWRDKNLGRSGYVCNFGRGFNRPPHFMGEARKVKEAKERWEREQRAYEEFEREERLERAQKRARRIREEENWYRETGAARLPHGRSPFPTCRVCHHKHDPRWLQSTNEYDGRCYYDTATSFEDARRRYAEHCADPGFGWFGLGPSDESNQPTKLDKLIALAEHPNTPPAEAEAARAAIERIREK